MTERLREVQAGTVERLREVRPGAVEPRCGHDDSDRREGRA